MEHQVELADGFVHLAGIQQNAAVTGMGVQVVRIDRDRPLVILAGLLVIEQCAIGAAQIKGRAAIVRVHGERFFEEGRGLFVILLVALLVELNPFIQKVERGRQTPDLGGRNRSGLVPAAAHVEVEPVVEIGVVAPDVPPAGRDRRNALARPLRDVEDGRRFGSEKPFVRIGREDVDPRLPDVDRQRPQALDPVDHE